MPTATSGLKDIPIAREIPGVSPPEPMKMSPVGDIEIAIEVVLGTTPTLTSPHWVSPVKLRADSAVAGSGGLRGLFDPVPCR